jgi:hypothetical protein
MDYLNDYNLWIWMKKKVERLITSLDLFGVPVSLLIKNESTFHTMLGSFMSLGVYAIALISLLSLL